MQDDALFKMNFLVISSNVGSLFENLKGIEEVWLKEIFSVVKKHQAHFVALHCQEVGGKDYKTSLQPVKDFYKKLVESPALRDFTTVRAFIDGDVEQADQYTALASFYFVHKSVKSASLFNFKTERFSSATGKQLYVNNLHKLPHVKKEKFPQSFAPDSKRSRKGFCRVRWRFCNKSIEFVNVHLFHDDSNLISIKSSPSPYTVFRKQALKYVLKKLNEDQPIENKNYFIFGDFNFRLDVKALVQSLCDSCQMQKVTSDEDEVVGIVFRKSEPNGIPAGGDKEKSKALISLEKKRFEIEQTLLEPLCERLRPFDLELPELGETLKEFEITFPPTYPFSENVRNSDHYMDTRCPSWCDRVLLSEHCWNWMQSQVGVKEFSYNTIGDSVCVGDHKPVCLAFTADFGDHSTSPPASSRKGGLASFFQSCSFI